MGIELYGARFLVRVGPDMFTLATNEVKINAVQRRLQRKIYGKRRAVPTPETFYGKQRNIPTTDMPLGMGGVLSSMSGVPIGSSGISKTQSSVPRPPGGELDVSFDGH